MKTVFKKGDVIKVDRSADRPGAVFFGRFRIGQRMLVLDSVSTVGFMGDTLCLDVLTLDDDKTTCKKRVWTDEADFVKVVVDK